MRRRKGISIALFVLSLALFACQAALWTHSIASARTETDKQNIEGHHPPPLFPALAGYILLIAAAVVVSIPQRVATHQRRS